MSSTSGNSLSAFTSLDGLSDMTSYNGQYTLTSTSHPSYGFYSPEENIFYVCDNIEQFKHFEVFVSIKSAEASKLQGHCGQWRLWPLDLAILPTNIRGRKPSEPNRPRPRPPRLFRVTPIYTLYLLLIQILCLWIAYDMESLTHEY